jgi:hypothetical protein
MKTLKVPAIGNSHCNEKRPRSMPWPSVSSDLLAYPVPVSVPADPGSHQGRHPEGMASFTRSPAGTHRDGSGATETRTPAIHAIALALDRLERAAAESLETLVRLEPISEIDEPIGSPSHDFPYLRSRCVLQHLRLSPHRERDLPLVVCCVGPGHRMRVRQAPAIFHKPESFLDNQLVACMIPVCRQHYGVVLPVSMRMVAVLNPVPRSHVITVRSASGGHHAGPRRAEHPIHVLFVRFVNGSQLCRFLWRPSLKTL